jgi:hypothetical protein
MESSDVPSSVPPRFVAFAWRYQRAPLLRFRSRLAPWLRTWAADRRPPELAGDDGTSQVPGRPSDTRRAPMTPAGPLCQAVQHSGAAATSAYGGGSRESAFEAQSRGSCPPCVRFAVEVALVPRNTRFRVVASLSRAGLTLRGLVARFQLSIFILLAQALPGAHAVQLRTGIATSAASGWTGPAAAGASPQEISDGEAVPFGAAAFLTHAASGRWHLPAPSEISSGCPSLRVTRPSCSGSADGSR